MARYDFLNGNRMAEIHMLKQYPSSALNRDDVGEQKTAYYNGTLRNRISSQCYKRAVRLSEEFTEAFSKKGIRTRKMPEYVAKRLQEELKLDSEEGEEIVRCFKIILAGEKNETGKKSKAEKALDECKTVNTQAIVFYSPEELEAIAQACIEIYNDLDEPKIKSIKKVELKIIQDKVKKTVKPMTVDVAAFGRMITDNTLRPVEGALQFAQILSTNAATKESDYFIACDDFVNGSEGDEAGAAMLGDIDYNSACYYFHSVADLEQFAENLKDCDNMQELVKQLPAKFAEIMAYTDPSARQNTFEAHVLPEVLYVEIKDKKRPLNRMKAFAQPCNRDILRSSVNAFANNISETNVKADLGIKHAIWYCEDENDGFKVPENVTIVHSIKDLCQTINDWMEG